MRHGHEAGEVTLGGRRVGVERPRVRSADGGSEVPLATYAYFADVLLYVVHMPASEALRHEFLDTQANDLVV